MLIGVILLVSVLQAALVVQTSVSQPLIPVPTCRAESGRIFIFGSVFTNNNCTTRCECLDSGIISCEPMCLILRKDHSCAKQKIVYKSVDLPDSEGKSCSCPSLSCENFVPKNEFCYIGGKKYKAGDYFISGDCSGSCTCRPGGAIDCVSLCPPTQVRCKRNEEKIELSRKIPNSNCTCPKWECVKRKRKDVCIAGDDVYMHGEDFITDDCTARCRCISGPTGQGFQCQNLCPLSNQCPPGETVHRTTKYAVPNSKCSCTEQQCIKKEDAFCEDSGEKHKVGEYFVTKSCNGWCKCTGHMSIACVSLCPPVGIMCSPGFRKVRTFRPVGGNCTCPSWKCVRDKIWEAWSDWTECGASCGGSLQYRFRRCMRNKRCFGPRRETKICNLAPCSPAYTDAPCGALRMNSATGDVWPRCDAHGYFEPLQCEPSTSKCWCVDMWGNVEPGSMRISQKPQCRDNSNDLSIQLSSTASKHRKE